MAEPARVFLDANILAKPVTRTLLIVAGPECGFLAVWSRTAVREADVHLGPGKTPVSDLSARFGWRLTPTGTDADRFAQTDLKDRQLLADAVAAKAQYLITEDVDDYGESDLVQTGISAVTADLFMSHRMSAAGYCAAIGTLVANRARPPSTPTAMHAALGRQHPLLTATHARLFDVEAMPATHPEPATIWRGARCLRCGHDLRTPEPIERGLCPECRSPR